MPLQGIATSITHYFFVFFTVTGIHKLAGQQFVPDSITKGQQPEAGQVELLAVKVYLPISENITTLPVATCWPFLYQITFV